MRVLHILDKLGHRPWNWAVPLVLLAGVATLYAWCIDTQIVGFNHDDGVYLLSAQAILAGKGFVLPHIPGSPEQLKYPIGYPAILALASAVWSDFPYNIPWLVTVTMTFALLALGLLYVYFQKIKQLPAWLALWIPLLTSVNFYWVFLSTCLMSEAPYAFFSILTLWLAEHVIPDKASDPSRKRIWWALLVLLSAATFHVRSIGLTLIVAIGIGCWYFRGFKQALAYGIPSLLLSVVPWWVWVKLHTVTSPSPVEKPLAMVYSPYNEEFIQNLQTFDYFKGVVNTLGELLYRIVEELLPVVSYYFELSPFKGLEQVTPVVRGYLILVLIVTYAVAGVFLIQGIRAIKKRQYSIMGGYLFLYSAAIVVWNYDNQVGRFIVPVLPLFWYFAFRPLFGWLQDKAPEHKRRVLTATSLILLIGAGSLWLSWHGAVNQLKFRQNHYVENGTLPELWKEYIATFGYIYRHVPEDAVIGAHWDTVFGLYTKRQTYYLALPIVERYKGVAGDKEIRALFPSLVHYGVNYVAVEPYMVHHDVESPANPLILVMMKQCPKCFERVYLSPRGMIELYRFRYPSLE